MKDSRFFSLDFIRAVAIFLVIVYHYNHSAEVLGFSASPLFINHINFINMGALAVSLFFILSGASLMLANRSFSLGSYFTKRFLAIYPLFWVSYAVVFTVIVLLKHKMPSDAPPVAFLLTLTAFDGLFSYKGSNFYLIGEWFIGAIVILYLLFPVLRYMLLKNKAATMSASLVVSFLSWKYLPLLSDMNPVMFPLSRLAEFVFGMAFVSLCRPPMKKLPFFIFLGLFLLSATISPAIPVIIKLEIMGASAFVCLSYLSRGLEKISSGLFSSGPLQGMAAISPVKLITFLSTYSYGAFLVHHLLIVKCIIVFNRNNIPPQYSYALFFAVAVLIYALSFVLTKTTNLIVRHVLPKK